MTKPKRPRILVTPSPQVWELLGRLHDLTGRAKAGLVAEMLDTVAPVIQGQLDAHERLAAAPEKAREIVADYAAEQVAKINQTVMEFEADGRTVEGKRKRRKGAHAAP